MSIAYVSPLGPRCIYNFVNGLPDEKREVATQVFETARLSARCLSRYYTLFTEGVMVLVCHWHIACCVSVLSVVLAGCGDSGELSCDSGGTNDTIVSILKEHPPSQLLSAASSDAIDKRGAVLGTERQSRQAQCNKISDQNWVKDFNADFPWYEPQPKSLSDDPIICLSHLHDQYIQKNTSDGMRDPRWNQVDYDAATLSGKCNALTGKDGHANWEACEASLQKFNEQGDQSIEKMTRDAYASVVYTLRNIRLQSKDQTTGAVECAAQLHADMPNFGSADEDITYKVEMTTDSKLYVTVQGAN